MTRILSVFNLLKRVGFALLLLVIIALARAQGPDTLWTRVLPHWNARARDVAVLDNGDLVVIGYVSNGISYDTYAARLDPAGNEIWFTQVGDTFASEYMQQLAIGPNQTIFVGGYRDQEEGDDPAIVYSFTENGEFATEFDFAVAGRSVQLFDFDVLVTGELLLLVNVGASPDHPLLVKLAANGDTVWTRELVELWIGSFGMRQLHVVEDGGCLITGSGFASEPGTQENLLIARCDSLGNVLFARDYGVIEELEIGGDALLLPDGGFLVVGQTTNCGPNWCGWVLRLDPQGDTLWSQTFSDFTYEYNHRCLLVADSGFVIGGDAFTGDGAFLCLTRLDQAGRLIWREFYQAGEWELLRTGLAVDAYGRYIMASSRNLSEAYVVMTEPDPFLSVIDHRSAQVLPGSLSFVAYPNPFNSTLSLSINLIKRDIVKLNLIDVLGRKVREMNLGLLNTGIYTYTIAVDNIPSGAYFVQVATTHSKQTQQITLLK